MKPFYTEYVTHCLRFYCRHTNPKFRSTIDRNNWIACDNAFKHFDSRNREWLIEIYRERDTLPDNVYQLSQREGIPQDRIWKIVYELERKVAENRGLI